MAWTLKGTWYESCSCELFCPCNLGPAKPTQEWCSGLLAFAFAFAVDSGESIGVDLGGTRFALHAELPGDFFGGIDRRRGPDNGAWGTLGYGVAVPFDWSSESRRPSS